MTTTDLAVRHPTSTLQLVNDWASLTDEALRIRAVKAANNRNPAELHNLLVAHATLTNRGRGGRALSPHTARSYATGVRALLRSWEGENLLRPTRNAGHTYVATLTNSLAPSTVQVRLAAAKALYRALRWADATEARPFEDIRAPLDTTPPWERRAPYTPAETHSLLQAAAALSGEAPLIMRTVVLLGAHGGLRASEMLTLDWRDVNFVDCSLLIRHGKGRQMRTVAASPAVMDALKSSRALSRPLGHLRSYGGLVKAMRRLCDSASVPRRGLHALRHAAGTRLWVSTGNLLDVANHLGHSQLDTTRIYAKWADASVREALSSWVTS